MVSSSTQIFNGVPAMTDCYYQSKVHQENCLHQAGWVHGFLMKTLRSVFQLQSQLSVRGWPMWSLAWFSAPVAHSPLKNVLWSLRCFSADHNSTEWLAELQWPFCHHEPVCPFSCLSPDDLALWVNLTDWCVWKSLRSAFIEILKPCSFNTSNHATVKIAQIGFFFFLCEHSPIPAQFWWMYVCVFPQI